MKFTHRWVLVLLVLGLLAPTRVAAHGVVAGGASVVVADAGVHSLRIEALVPIGAPSVLRLQILVTTPLQGAGAVTVGAVAAGGAEPALRTIPFDRGTQLAQTDVAIDRLGSWDISIGVTDDRGRPGLFVLPITVRDVVIPPATIPLFVGFAVMAAILAIQILWMRAPAWVGSVARVGMVAGLTVVVGVGSLSLLPQVRLEWNTTVPAALPFFGVTTATNLSVVRWVFHDGATGLPVDDFVPHHQALVHTVCIDQDTGHLEHVHPARVAAATYQLDRTSLPPGRYDCTHEAERLNSGAQVVHSVVEIPGAQGAAVTFGSLGAAQTVGTLRATVAPRAAIRVGTPVTLDVTFHENGVPVTAITPWLGMRGHLIVRARMRSIFGHVHAVGAMDAAFAPVPQPGNTVSFVYAFPVAGWYELWFQAQIGTQIVTVPVQVDVSEGNE